MTLHSHRQSFRSTQGQETIERTGNSPHRILDEGQLFVQGIIGSDECSTDHIRVSSQILGHRVDDDVRPQCQRLLQVRSGKGVVDHQQHAFLPADFRNRSNVGDSQQRIGWSLQPHHTGLVGDGIADLIRISRVDEIKTDPHRLIHLGENPVGSSVEIVAGNDMILRLHQFQNRIRRSQSTGETEAMGSPFEGSQIAFKGAARRVTGAGIFITLMHSGSFLNIRGSQVDRGHDRSGTGVRVLPGVDCACFEFHDQDLLPLIEWIMSYLVMMRNPSGVSTRTAADGLLANWEKMESALAPSPTTGNGSSITLPTSQSR